MLTSEIFELFQKHLPYEWQSRSPDYWRATFTVNGTEYSITADVQEDFVDAQGNEVPFWELSFGLTSDGFSGTRVIGTGHKEMLIFSTVLRAFEEFLRAVEPETFCISASKENPNRYRVYQAIARRFDERLERYGYRRTTPPRYRYLDTSKSFDTMCFTRA